MNSRTKKLVSLLCVAAILVSALPMSVFAADEGEHDHGTEEYIYVNGEYILNPDVAPKFETSTTETAALFAAPRAVSGFRKAEGYQEGAYATWPIGAGVTKYEAYVAPAGGNYVKLDDKLVREYPGYMRADALGLKAGTYTIKVVDNLGNAMVTDPLTVVAHERTGFGFVNGTSSGAYNADGTLKSNAVVVYVDNSNFNSVQATIGSASYTGVQSIVSESGASKGAPGTPVCIRVLGTIDTTGFPKGSWGSSAEGLQVKAGSAKAKNLTIEGVGNDATFNGFGMLIRNCENVEVRNLAFMNFADDGVSIDTGNKYLWVHNNDFFYGGPGSDSDQAKGDGSLDVKASHYCSFSYNHFWDSGKCSLLGMHNDQNYITYHHNWFDHSDSRHPRIRIAKSVHIYNNYYDGNSKYGVGAAENSGAFVEANYFRNTKYPMLSSMQGSDIAGGGKGTFSGEPGGIIKAYNNKIIGAHAFIPYDAQSAPVEFDAYVAKTRGEKVPGTVAAKLGGTTYTNFDTTENIGVTAAQVQSPDDAMLTTTKWAGRVDGGDFQWVFNNAVDDESYAVNAGLKSALTAYKTTLVSVGGTVTKPISGGDTPSHTHTPGAWKVTKVPGCDPDTQALVDGEETQYCTVCGEVLDTRPLAGAHSNDGNGECTVCHKKVDNGGGPTVSGDSKILKSSDFTMTNVSTDGKKSEFVANEVEDATDGYFHYIGSVVKRNGNGDNSNGTTIEGTKAEFFELPKNSTDGFHFTVGAGKTPATVIVSWGSPKDAQKAIMAIRKDGEATPLSIETKGGKSFTTTLELQEAGKYWVTSGEAPSGTTTYGTRIFSITVTEAPKSHTWSDWEVVTPATCGQDGLMKRTCQDEDCGEVEYETIDATGNHTWGDWVAGDDGEEVHTCTVCGETESKTGEPPTPSVTVSKVELNKTTLTLEVSKNEKLTATVTVTPDDAANKTVTWKSSNAAVATVNSDGTVIAKAVGTATITATSDKDSSKTASCAVTVKAKTADKSGLTDIIAKANAAVDGVAENTDAANVPVGTSWALKADINDFKAAIAKAQAVADKADATADDVSKAVADLNAAITAFATKLKDGTKPNGGGSTPAKIFESKNLTAFSSGKSDGDTEQAGTDNYFTIIYSSSSKVDNSSKSWGDGYESGQRLNLGGKLDPSKNAVKFTTGGAATVKVWFVQGGDDNRQMGIITENKTAVATSNVEGMTKGNPYYAELSISAAGTYFLGGKEGNNYIFKIEVVETASGSDDPTPVDKSALTAAIATAEADLAAAIESVDGSEVESDKKWVSKEDKELFAAEIALAKLSAKTAKTDAEVTAAINALKAASDAFEAAAQSGVKDEGGDTPIIPDDPGSGGGGGGGGGGSSASKTDKIVDTTITVDGTVKDGVAVAEVTDAQAKTLTGNAVKNNSENIVVVIDGEADTARLNISANALKNMSSRTDAALNVQTGLGTVKLPAAAVADLGSNSGKSISVIVAKTEVGMKLTIGVGNKIQDQVSGGVTAVVPAQGSGSVAYLVAADGSEKLVKKSYVDGGKLHANLPGSGEIILKDNTKTFRDTADSWAKEAIDFAASRELFNGVNELDFAPNQTMTRSMLVTVLYRLEGAKSGAANKFADVNADSWYAEAVAWANAEGIVSGKSETHFGPNDDITREQLATILYRYATGLCGMDEVSEDSKALEKFSDKAVVSGFAADGMAWAVEQGVIGGRSDGTLAPGGFASRAEVATMLMRFVKAII